MRVPVPLSLTGGDAPVHAFSMRGTLTLCGCVLSVFAVFYAMDWMWLGRLWQFGS